LLLLSSLCHSRTGTRASILLIDGGCALTPCLLQVKIKREGDYSRAEAAKNEAAESYRVLQRAEGLAAQLSNKERALKEKVSIDAGMERSRARVAEKADEIARKMQALADHADSQWSKAKSELASDSKGFEEVKDHASKALSDAKEKESARREAEKAATAAAKQLAELDRTIQGLLAKKSQLEDQANAQDASSATVSARESTPRS
jgi:uncharacterized coiled-coil DUF342 family protein